MYLLKSSVSNAHAILPEIHEVLMTSDKKVGFQNTYPEFNLAFLVAQKALQGSQNVRARKAVLCLPPVRPQAALINALSIINSIAILSEDRFLLKSEFTLLNFDIR
jgi:hypothetical protein